MPYYALLCPIMPYYAVLRFSPWFLVLFFWRFLPPRFAALLPPRASNGPRAVTAVNNPNDG